MQVMTPFITGASLVSYVPLHQRSRLHFRANEHFIFCCFRLLLFLTPKGTHERLRVKADVSLSFHLNVSVSLCLSLDSVSGITSGIGMEFVLVDT